MWDEKKTPISRTLPRMAQQAAFAELERRGYALPCHVSAVSGQIVTVVFDCTVNGATLQPVTMAIQGAEYIRMPTQVGDKGYAAPSSVDISIETGLGPANSLPDLSTPPANLSALVFVPVGNKNWTPSPNPNATVIYGPQGVILQDKSGSAPDFSVIVNADGVLIQSGANAKIALNSTGLGAFGAAPIAQPTTAIGPAAFVAGSGTNVTSTSTFDDYTIPQVVKALRNLGWLA